MAKPSNVLELYIRPESIALSKHFGLEGFADAGIEEKDGKDERKYDSVD